MDRHESSDGTVPGDLAYIVLHTSDIFDIRGPCLARSIPFIGILPISALEDTFIGKSLTTNGRGKHEHKKK